MATESGIRKIEDLKLFCPIIFNTRDSLKDHLLSRAFQNATLVGSIPNDFEGEDVKEISPFNNFVVRYDVYENQAHANRWRLITDFRLKQESRKPKLIFGVRYDGNYDKERKESGQSDKLMISFFTDNQKLLVDLGTKKIGFRFKQGNAGINLEAYEVQIAFDQLGNKSQIEELFNESGIKVYDFEINEETNTLAFKYQGKEFKDETIITLPLKITVNNDIQSSVKPQAAKRYLSTTRVVKEKYVPKIQRFKEIKIMLDNHILIITIKENEILINIEDLHFNLDQLKILFYLYKKNYRRKETSKITGISLVKIKNLLSNLVVFNFDLYENDNELIVSIFDKACKLNIMNKKFIEALEQKLTQIQGARKGVSVGDEVGVT